MFQVVAFLILAALAIQCNAQYVNIKIHKQGLPYATQEIQFLQGIFTNFSDCLCQSYDRCLAKCHNQNDLIYNVTNVTSEGQPSVSASGQDYYRCSLDTSSDTYICTGEPNPPSVPGPEYVSSKAFSSQACNSVCVGIIWEDCGDLMFPNYTSTCGPSSPACPSTTTSTTTTSTTMPTSFTTTDTTSTTASTTSASTPTTTTTPPTTTTTPLSTTTTPSSTTTTPSSTTTTPPSTTTTPLSTTTTPPSTATTPPSTATTPPSTATTPSSTTTTPPSTTTTPPSTAITSPTTTSSNSPTAVNTGTTSSSISPILNASSPTTSSPPTPSKTTPKGIGTAGTNKNKNNQDDGNDEELLTALITTAVVAGLLIIIMIIACIIFGSHKKRSRRQLTSEYSDDNSMYGDMNMPTFFIHSNKPGVNRGYLKSGLWNIYVPSEKSAWGEKPNQLAKNNLYREKYGSYGKALDNGDPPEFGVSAYFK